MKFYSSWYCPFAQRSWLALLHKGVTFDYVETDPYDKNPEWMALSRGVGQVPVLVEGDGPGIPGSVRNLEYLDMRFADVGPRLFPKTAAGIADAKFWLDYQDRRIVPYFYRFLKAEPGSEAAEAARVALEQGLEEFALNMSDEGPYFSGKEPGAVDMGLAPFALRIEILLGHYRQYELPTEGPAWVRYHTWWGAMRQFKPLVVSSTGLPNYSERLIEFYLPYAQGGGQQDVTEI
ncbi:MAG: glutathione S-transferase family protein [Alphaproteobacteria bacterium]